MNISIYTRYLDLPPRLTPAQKAFAVDEELTVMIEDVCKYLNLNSDDYFADRMSGSENASIRKAMEARLNITSDAGLENLWARLDGIRELF